jgi:hypothetical protein
VSESFPPSQPAPLPKTSPPVERFVYQLPERERDRLRDHESFARQYPQMVTALVAVLISIVTFFVLRGITQADKERAAADDFKIQIATLNIQLMTLNKNVEALSTQMQGVTTLGTEVKVLQEKINSMKQTVESTKTSAPAEPNAK